MVCAGITYDSVNNRLYVKYNAADGTRGASFTDPYTLTDIYDTDVANGWGKMTNPIPRTYYCKSKIYIENEDTYFQINSERLLFDATGLSYRLGIWTYSNSNFKCISNLYEMSYISVVYGSSQRIDLLLFGGDAHFENTVLSYLWSIINYTYTYMHNVIVYYCVVANLPGYNGNLEADNITLIKSALQSRSDFISNNNIQIIDTGYGLYVYSGATWTLYNLKVLDCSIDITVYINNYGNDNVLVDSNVDLTKRNVSGGTGSKNLFNKSNFCIDITDGDGGVATLYDKDNNVVATQTLSGVWNVLVTFEKLECEMLDGVVTKNTLTSYEPFTLRVTKPGYQDLEIPGIEVRRGEKTDVHGKLTPLNIIYKDRTLDVSIKDNIELDLVVEDKKELSLVVDIHSY